MRTTIAFLAIAIFLPTVAFAQQKCCRVVDAETKAGLEGVLVNSRSGQTLTNAEGRDCRHLKLGKRR